MVQHVLSTLMIPLGERLKLNDHNFQVPYESPLYHPVLTKRFAHLDQADDGNALLAVVAVVLFVACCCYRCVEVRIYTVSKICNGGGKNIFWREQGLFSHWRTQSARQV